MRLHPIPIGWLSHQLPTSRGETLRDVATRVKEKNAFNWLINSRILRRNEACWDVVRKGCGGRGWSRTTGRV